MIPNPMTTMAREALNMSKDGGTDGAAFRKMAIIGMGAVIGLQVVNGIVHGVKLLSGHQHENRQNQEIERLWRAVIRLEERHARDKPRER